MELWHLESGSNFKKTAEVQVNVKKLNFNSKVLKNIIIKLWISNGFNLIETRKYNKQTQKVTSLKRIIARGKGKHLSHSKGLAWIK